MNRPIYNWQYPDWPHFTWDNDSLTAKLAQIHHQQGILEGKLSSLGFEVQNHTTLDTLTAEITGSSGIEGVILNPEMVRSSLAKHLNLDMQGLPVPSHYVEGVVQVMMDAVTHCRQPLTDQRLFGWHSALFPYKTGHLLNITVGNWRTGPEAMQVVSGAMGHEHVHYEAPPSERVPILMDSFLNWVNQQQMLDPIVKAAIAHLWLVSIHPFDDGNGRITRTVTEMLLARGDGLPQRFYSLSAEIAEHRNNYYDILEATQRRMDITDWLDWFVNTLDQAVDTAICKVELVCRKNSFWERHRMVAFNERQTLIINRLWDGFEGKLTTQKWAKITKCSPDTALRDINDLITKGVLVKNLEGGRSTSYRLVE